MSELELKKLELDAAHEAQVLEHQTRRAEIAAGVRKVVYGTMIVGIVAAMFPFLIALAELFTTRSVEQIKADAEIRVVEETNRLERELAAEKAGIERQKDTHSRLESLAKEGRSEDIAKRIVLAQYYSHLAVDDDDRKRWQAFLAYLVGLQGEEIAASNRAVDTGLSDAERGEALQDLARIQEITRPSPSIYVSRNIAVLQDAMNRSQLCANQDLGDRIFVDGIYGPQTEHCLRTALGLSGADIRDLLAYQEGIALLLEVINGQADTSILSTADRTGWRPVPTDGFLGSPSTNPMIYDQSRDRSADQSPGLR
ncbi:hypothetical protein AB0T83_06770 [Fluviibacterium sp. DFM31]|uniref:Peptidoglycan binding-like domain-containing protein n=1 Tax=Meridianimarinicoccus marinus TaxID=3231483 RepID=A0ABV3L4H7_9RHOB